MTTSPSTPRGPASVGGARRPIVLIVEDEEPIAEVLVCIVEEAGYAAVVAPHGKVGLALALQHRPAIIFTDLMMPQMGGRELILSLHAALNSSTPPIVLMTAADVRYADTVGADSVLKKPFVIEAVEALLRRFVRDVRDVRDQHA